MAKTNWTNDEYVKAQDMNDIGEEINSLRTDIDNIPDASLTKKGLTKLSNATDSVSESEAATPKAIHDALINAKSYTDSVRVIPVDSLSPDSDITEWPAGTSIMGLTQSGYTQQQWTGSIEMDIGAGGSYSQIIKTSVIIDANGKRTLMQEAYCSAGDIDMNGTGPIVFQRLFFEAIVGNWSHWTKVTQVSDIPPASLTKAGIVQLSSATNSTSETLAATPKAVKAAYDLANSGLVPRSAAGVKDFNNLTTPGMYTIGEASELTNNPGAAGWGLLVVEATSQPYIVQRFFAIGNGGGRIFMRARSEGAASWTAWKEIATTDKVQQPLTNVRQVELGLNVPGAGQVYIDFHSGASVVDYDARIIADGGNGGNQGGNLNLQAANIWLNGESWVDKVWIARNTAFGPTTALDLAMGDSDTGFDWVEDGRIDFYSNAQVPVRLIGQDFQFKNAQGSYESLSGAINSLKQLSNDQKAKWAGVVVGKGGSASSDMTSDQLVTVTNNLTFRHASLNDSLRVDTLGETNPNGQTTTKNVFTVPANSQRCFLYGSGGMRCENTNPIIEQWIDFVDQGGIVASCAYHSFQNGSQDPGESLGPIRFDKTTGQITWTQNGSARSASIPGNFNTNAPYTIRFRMYYAYKAGGDGIASVINYTGEVVSM